METAGGMGMEMPPGMHAQRSAEPAATPTPQADTHPAQADKPQAPTPADAVQEGVKALRGILRF